MKTIRQLEYSTLQSWGIPFSAMKIVKIVKKNSENDNWLTGMVWLPCKLLMAVWASACVLNFTKAQPVGQKDMMWSVRRRTNSSHTHTHTHTRTHMSRAANAKNRSFPIPPPTPPMRGSWASTKLRCVLEKALGDVSYTTKHSCENQSCKLRLSSVHWLHSPSSQASNR